MIDLPVSEEGRCAHLHRASPTLLSRDRLNWSFVSQSWSPLNTAPGVGGCHWKNWVACTGSRRQSPWPGVTTVTSTQSGCSAWRDNLQRAEQPLESSCSMGEGLAGHPFCPAKDTHLFLWRALQCGLKAPQPLANHLASLLRLLLQYLRLNSLLLCPYQFP